MRYSVDMPGPGKYEQKLQFNKTGNYTFYKWKNSGAPLFSRATRATNLDTSATRKSSIDSIHIFLVTPGPGTYRVQTEFGFYDPNENLMNMSVNSGNGRRKGSTGGQKLGHK